MGLFGPPNVEKLKAKEDVQGLIKALQYKEDASIRKGAAIALRDIGDDRAEQFLLAALQDEDADVRMGAIEALEKCGGEQAARELIRLLLKEA